MKTGFYPGCSLKGSSREYAESTLALARALEMPLQEIDDWNCCGASSAHAVDKELALAFPHGYWLWQPSRASTKWWCPVRRATTVCR